MSAGGCGARYVWFLTSLEVLLKRSFLFCVMFHVRRGGGCMTNSIKSNKTPGYFAVTRLLFSPVELQYIST